MRLKKQAKEIGWYQEMIKMMQTQGPLGEYSI